MNDADAVCYS
jgi:hypothetical protein